ncbi:MAG: hypothetical protein GF349_01265 [Candidatus Magasanikbacteria bacterium]|nr:hypothetical protein [Candidatus Magasanikbacteria bacterium]
MAYPYNFKVVVSGKHVEVYKYKKQVWRDFSKKQNINTHKEPKQLDIFKRIKNQKIKKTSSLNRTRTEIRRLTNSNPQLNKFLTLTFSDNITDLKEANYIFNKFILRMNYKYPNFEYLAVPEFQQRGAVHYHVLCNLPFVHYKELTDIWGQGNIDIKKIKDITNLGAYICKYLGKDMFDERTFGKKKFFRSQTLKKPVEILGWSATKFIDLYLKLLNPTFEKTFESEYIGEVNYRAFALDFIPFEKGVFDRNVIFQKL